MEPDFLFTVSVLIPIRHAERQARISKAKRIKKKERLL